MPTDQLLRQFDDDPDLDRALREMLPPMPRSITWEARQRAALLTFIETGDVQAERAAPSSVEAVVVALQPPDAPDRRGRAVVALGVAAAAVLLVAGLVTAPRWRGQENPPASAPAATIPPPVALAGVDRFPVAVGAGEVTAFLVDEDPSSMSRRTSALLARVDDSGTLNSTVVVEAVDAHHCEESDCRVVDRVEVDGRDAIVYEEPGGRRLDPLLSLVLPGAGGEPTVVVTGADPVAFVAGAGGSPVRLLPDTAEGELEFRIERMPDSYQVVLPPTPYVRGAEWGGIRIGASAEQAVAAVVRPNSELFRLGRLGPIHPIDVGGVQGWTYDVGWGSPVIWQVSPTTWASVTGAPTQEAAIELARSLQFTDRTTWEGTYEVRSAIDELPATAIGNDQVPGPATTAEAGGDEAPRVECVVTEPSSVEVGGRLQVGCGTADGVVAGMPVVVGSGAVGVVTEASVATSVVVLANDAQFSVAAVVRDTDVVGVLRGGGPDRSPILTLSDPTRADQVLTGTVVSMTNGWPIGRVGEPGDAPGSFLVQLGPSLAPDAETVTVLLAAPPADGSG